MTGAQPPFELAPTEYRHRHSAPTRIEGAEKVTGRARYTSDVELPGQLYAGIVRSRHANARVRAVHTAAARRIPGVRDILTAADTSGVRWYEEQCPFFTDTPRFVGDELAAVAAETEDAVADALAAVEVEYEPLDCAADLFAAQARGAPEVHEGARGNLAGEPEVYERGDAAAALAAADVIVEATYTTQTAVHNALEAHACNAAWIDGVLNLWVSTQGINAVRKDVADKLGLSPERVRVRAAHIGGGFGAKQIEWKPTLVAALLAGRTGNPVKIVLDRTAESLAVGNRNATRQHVKLGARRDGTLEAIAASVEIEVGAYTVAGERSNVAGCYKHLYQCDNVRTEQRRFYTHMGPAVAFRGPGYVEGLFALEQAIDELARELDMDPIALRERNYARTDQFKGKPYSSPDALSRCYAALGTARSESFRNERHAPEDGATLRQGHGVAAGIWLAGGPNPPAEVSMTVEDDGSVCVKTGTQDIGTGTRTVIAQLAAEGLALPIERVRVELGDTASGLEAPTSAGSATLPTVGPAVSEAARALEATLLAFTAERLGVDAAALELTDGAVGPRDDPDAGLTLAELARLYAPRPLSSWGTCESAPDDVVVRTFAACAADVTIDSETGELTVQRLICAPDCGRVVNPILATSQVVGGVTQALGFALTEQRIVDRARGRVLNANLEDYLVPTVADVPEIEHAFVDLPDPHVNTLGVKGLGEPPLIAVAPAIANAVFDAVGVRIRNLPINRKRLLEALAGSTPEAS